MIVKREREELDKELIALRKKRINLESKNLKVTNEAKQIKNFVKLEVEEYKK